MQYNAMQSNAIQSNQIHHDVTLQRNQIFAEYNARVRGKQCQHGSNAARNSFPQNIKKSSQQCLHFYLYLPIYTFTLDQGRTLVNSFYI